MGWLSVVVLLGCGMAFCCGGAGLWDVVILLWCWFDGWCSVEVVLDCGMAFRCGGAGLSDGIN